MPTYVSCLCTHATNQSVAQRIQVVERIVQEGLEALFNDGITSRQIDIVSNWYENQATLMDETQLTCPSAVQLANLRCDRSLQGGRGDLPLALCRPVPRQVRHAGATRGRHARLVQRARRHLRRDRHVREGWLQHRAPTRAAVASRARLRLSVELHLPSHHTCDPGTEPTTPRIRVESRASRASSTHTGRVPSRLVQTNITIIFAPGIPHMFHSNYQSTLRFIASIEELCASKSELQALRAHPAYSEFQRRWNLPVYFGLKYVSSCERVVPRVCVCMYRCST